jgi:hypothetical protein
MQQLARQMWAKRAARMGIRIEALPKAQNTDSPQS